ncbi:MAG: hypothetical protein ACTSUE_21630 [Promethearchaeota archaeon]
MICSDDPGRQAMKMAIKKTLLQFDVLSQQINNLKSRNKGTPNHLVNQLSEELGRLNEQKRMLEEEFDKLEEACRRMILEDAERNAKKIKKLYQKLKTQVEQNQKYIRMMQQIQSKLSVLNGNGGSADSEQIRIQYKTTFEIIQDFRQNLPEVYSEVEQETGIFFFSTPR